MSYNFKDQRGKKNHNYRHGMKGTTTHNTWHLMTLRCRNKNAPDYHRYGGRGITVCERWYKFENFLEDMGVRPEGKTLDRIDNSLGYFKENCRWATKKEQHRNTRQNKFLTYRGETLAMVALAEKYGIAYKALRQRIANGWPLERAFTEPVSSGRRPNSVYIKHGQPIPIYSHHKLG